MMKSKHVKFRFRAKVAKTAITDLVVDVPLNLSVVFTGGIVNKTYFYRRVCEECLGYGCRKTLCNDIKTCSTTDECMNCEYCNGLGIAYYVNEDSNNARQISQRKCKKCNGKGKILKPGEKRCQYCDGTGLSLTEGWLQIPVMKGFKDGQELVFEGFGHDRLDGTSGDAVFRLKYVMPSGKFRREANSADLMYERQINLEDMDLRPYNETSKEPKLRFQEVINGICGEKYQVRWKLRLENYIFLIRISNTVTGIRKGFCNEAVAYTSIL